MNAIEIRSLTRVFGAVRAVDAVTLDVARGTILGLLGLNGAGKSTLLKLLVGHLRATSGEAILLGKSVPAWASDLWLRVGYVAQGRYLPPWMTAAECLRFARAMNRGAWDDKRVRDLVERFQLPPDGKIGELSRGISVRLQIVLALAHNPEIVILDEPTSGLDPAGRAALLTLLIDEIGLRGCTVVLSSHIVEDIERMADAVAILDAGRIVAHGAPDEIRRLAGIEPPSLQEVFLSLVDRRSA